ncbi:MAG TPA: hypothetical protein PKE63_00990 [Lacibacter sp.]|nr:hypothetical protein [Lacibacter sp.]HMO90054.1 hypothetical protein [Lacibacter sp.]HMP85816.1 hypothetical protein [Lacibacter sp.]
MKPKHARFYLIITILSLFMVLLGFGKSFFLRPFFEQPSFLKDLPTSVYIHGTLMTIWYIMLVAQSALVNVKKVKLHMTLGWGLVAVACLLIISGLIVNAGAFPRFIAVGFLDVASEGMMLMAASFWTYDQTVFVPFGLMIATAIFKRKNIIIHRSMMLGASMLMLNPAIIRMAGWMFPGFVLPAGTLIYLLFPISLIVHDWVRYKKFPLYPFIAFVAIIVITFLMIWLPSTDYGMDLFKRTINV